MGRKPFTITSEKKKKKINYLIPWLARRTLLRSSWTHVFSRSHVVCQYGMNLTFLIVFTYGKSKGSTCFSSQAIWTVFRQKKGRCRDSVLVFLLLPLEYTFFFFFFSNPSKMFVLLCIGPIDHLFCLPPAIAIICNVCTFS